MGGGKLKAAVIDAGPLIHLAEIGCLRFLQVFETLFAPHAVWLETMGESRISESDLSVATNLKLDTLVQSEVDHFAEQNNLSELHAGERECLHLCQKRGISPC